MGIRWRNKSKVTANASDRIAVTSATSDLDGYTTPTDIVSVGMASADRTKLNNLSGTNTGDQDLSGKQDVLVSGTNIKTINSQSLLGSGDVSITAGVASVNGDTGAVVLDADDISDTSTTHKFVTSGYLTVLSNTSGTNSGDQVGDGVTITGTGAVGDPFVAVTSGGGTVTDVSVTTANGISGTVATSTTTPAISLSLGAITPTSVSATSFVAVTPTTDTIAGVFRRNSTGQTADVLQIQTEANAKLAGFDKTGKLEIPAVKITTGAAASKVLTSDASGNATWENNPAGFADPMTTRGDIIVRNASNTTARLPIGSTGLVLKSDGTDVTWGTVSGTGDMLLATPQSVTGLKTFDKDKAAMKGTSTGVNTISVANTSATSYTNTIPAKTGTFAMLDDITGTVTNVSALTIGTTGTDLSSTVVTGTTTPVITLNVPTASATNRGVLSAADWSTFNGKQVAGTYSTDIHSNITALNNVTNTNTGDETQSTIKSKLGAAAVNADGYLSQTDWGTFNGKLSDIVNDTTPQLGGNLDATDKNITGVGMIGFTQELDNGSKAGSFTVDFGTDQKQKVTLTANTMTITLDTTNVKVANYQLKIVNGGLATKTWATETGSIKWAGGAAPTLTNSGTDIISFYWDGAAWYGASTLNFS